MSRTPTLVISGPPFTPKDGPGLVQPYALIHPCLVDGCEAPAPVGIGVNILAGELGTWACTAHEHLLLTPTRQTGPVKKPEPADAQRTEPRSPADDLFGG